MASLWKNKYFLETLARDFKEAFTSELSIGSTDEYTEGAIPLFQRLLKQLEEEVCLGAEQQRKCDKFDTALDTLVTVCEYARDNSTRPNPTQFKMVEKCLDSVLKSSRLVFLSGEWILYDKGRKAHFELVLRLLLEQVTTRRENIQGMLTLSEDPWGSEPIRKLINGKMEKEEDVLALLSRESVEGVLLRIEMLVESSLDLQAYKAVAAVVSCLLAEEMILESYTSTSTPGTLERLTDIFIALSTALHRETKLFKVLKLLGLETVNDVYIRRFDCYIKGVTDSGVSRSAGGVISTAGANPLGEHMDTDIEMKDEVKKEAERSKETVDKIDESETETADKQKPVPEESASASSRFHQLEKGRCDRLFTPAVCSKTLEIIFQWSLAGAAVKESCQGYETYLISEWIDKCSGNKTRLMEDVDILMELATQTNFLYTLAYQLYTRLGKEVETKSLSIFVRALTSDINEYEAAKRNKTSKSSMENKLARGFWLLSEVLSERTSLCRECVLTGFSIKPEQRTLDRLVELAKLSGVDQTQADSEDEGEDGQEKETTVNAGIHCRVTIGSEVEQKKFLKAYHQRRKTKTIARSMAESLNGLDQIDAEFENAVTLFLTQLTQEKAFSVAPTKLRTNKPREKKKIRNLEGLISIRGELVTEAANYNPLEMPCQSLQPTSLNLESRLTDDLLIIVSAPRWHMLSWVMSWPELHQACVDLLNNPSLREPIEELKYLNIDYTQFNGWSSDEEVTIFTGIEKGYERWLIDGPDNEDEKVSEEGASSEEEISHTVPWENYDDVDKYQVPEDYSLLVMKDPADTGKTRTRERRGEKEKKSGTKEEEGKEERKEEKKEEGKEERKEEMKEGAEKDKKKDEGKKDVVEKGRKRKATPDIFPEKVPDEFCKETPESPVPPLKIVNESMEVD